MLLLANQSWEEFKACGRSSDCMKYKQIRSVAMARMTSYCIKFKAGYCQETCKAVGVCTQLILGIPWNQTKDSIGKADGGLNHSPINCCQLPELSRGSKLCVPQARLWLSSLQRDCSIISFDLILQWMQPCFSIVEKFLSSLALCSLKNENSLLAGKQI